MGDKPPHKSATVIGAFIFAVAYVLPACVGVPESTLSELYKALGVLVAVFFTYRGSKMGVANGNGK